MEHRNRWSCQSEYSPCRFLTKAVLKFAVTVPGVVPVELVRVNQVAGGRLRRPG